MESKKNVSDYAARIVTVMCIILFVYIMFAMIAKNVFYDVLGMTNPIIDYFAGIEEDELTEGAEAEVEIDWKEKYPFDEVETEKSTGSASTSKKYTELIGSIEQKIEWYPDNAIPYKDDLTMLAGRIENAIGCDLQLSDDENDIIYMKNGYMTYVQPEVSDADLDEIAESVSDFDSYLADKGISFLYINAGSKVCPEDKELYSENIEYTNENGDALLSRLEQSGVDILDLRTEMLEDGLDWYASYYKTDHHWTTETGLWAAEKIAELLNEDYGFCFNMDKLNISEYQKTTFEDFWIGNQGRTDAFARCELESYTLLLPEFETEFTINIPTRNINLTGAYADSLVELKLLEKIKNYSKNDFLNKPDAYHCSQLRNDALTTIENHLQTNNDGKKILFIQDSFAWYSTTFLATDISQIDVIYPMQFDGSIRAYIEESKPDMVIMMYCERNIKEIDWDTHKSAFDLR